MENDKKAKELEYLVARNQLEQEIESYLISSGHEQAGLEIPSFHFEKGITKFSFSHNAPTKILFYDALQTIFNHFERVQMYSYEKDFVEVQDIGPILSPHKNLSQGIKFQFVLLLSSHKVHVKKQGNFTQDELQACIKLFQLFHPIVEEAIDPTKKLQSLGTQVFLPQTKTEQQELPEKKALQQETVEGENAKETGGIEKQELTKTSENSRILNASNTKYLFKGFAGYKGIRNEVLETILLPLQHADIFAQVAQQTRGEEATNLPKAVLFQGPAGVGKTTMAKLVSQYSGIPMVYVPIENILSKYYGESAQNLASVFDAASHYNQAIIFIDEIDALATSREQGLYEATRRVLSVLLRKLDGMESRSGTLMIGATNRTEDLDRALLSRFDTVLHFPLPNVQERALIFLNYAQHLDNQKLEPLAHTSKGLSGRNIEDICEYTERRWARQLIAEQKSVSPPPLDLYLEVTKTRQAQQQIWDLTRAKELTTMQTIQV